MKTLYQIIVLTFIACNVFSQPTEKLGNLVGTEPLKVPLEYLKRSWDNTPLPSSRKHSSVKWTVTVDRANVTSSAGLPLDVFENYIVVKKKGEYLYLVEDRINGSSFSHNPKHYGWVHESHLLLWRNALYGNNNFRVKIMTTSRPENLKGELDRLTKGGKRLPVYASPTDTDILDIKVNMFEIFYVLKRENNRLLVSKRESLEGGRAKDYILGWIDEASAQIWAQRQVLQPNMHPTAVKERVAKGVKVAAFVGKNDVERYSNGEVVSQLWSYPDSVGKTKIDPYWMRMPVFKKEGEVITTAVISKLYTMDDDGGYVELSAKKMERVKRLVNEGIERKRNINLVFLVDGTNSMGPYFQSVRNAVLRSVGKLKELESENKFQFGAMVYRDYIDKNDASCYETFPLNADVSQFSRFINSVDTQKPGCGNKSISEGMFLGFKKVFTDILRGNKKATNIIIVVGDTGDRIAEGRVKVEDIIPKLVEYQTSVMALQVHMKDAEAYEDFQFQVNGMMTLAAKKVVENLNKNYGDYKHIDYVQKFLEMQPTWHSQDSKDDDFFRLMNSPLSASMQCARLGSSMDVDLTTNKIVDIIMEVDAYTDRFLKKMGSLMIEKDDTNGEGNFGAAAFMFLDKAGLDDDDKALLTRTNFNFLLEAKTCLKNKKLTKDLYEYQLFLDNMEVDHLIADFSKLTVPGLTGSARREALYNNWLGLLRTNYGIKDPAEIEHLSISDINELMTGLPSLNKIFQTVRLVDILDKNRFSDRDLDRAIYGIKESMNRIQQRIVNTPPKRNSFMFLSNERRYFWIPQSYLP